MEIQQKNDRFLLIHGKEIIGIFSDIETAKDNKRFFEQNFERFKNKEKKNDKKRPFKKTQS